MAKNTKAAELLKVLGQKTPAVEPTASPSQSPPNTADNPPARKPIKTVAPHARPERSIRGKAVQFYLHDEDAKLIRELAVWLAPHRKRINDSLVVKTVLRAAKTGPTLLAAYDEAVAIDGRSKAHKKTKQQA